jgi:hypothetical protein
MRLLDSSQQYLPIILQIMTHNSQQYYGILLHTSIILFQISNSPDIDVGRIFVGKMTSLVNHSKCYHSNSRTNSEKAEDVLSFHI